MRIIDIENGRALPESSAEDMSGLFEIEAVDTIGKAAAWIRIKYGPIGWIVSVTQSESGQLRINTPKYDIGTYAHGLASFTPSSVHADDAVISISDPKALQSLHRDITIWWYQYQFSRIQAEAIQAANLRRAAMNAMNGACDA